MRTFFRYSASIVATPPSSAARRREEVSCWRLTVASERRARKVLSFLPVKETRHGKSAIKELPFQGAAKKAARAYMPGNAPALLCVRRALQFLLGAACVADAPNLQDFARHFAGIKRPSMRVCRRVYSRGRLASCLAPSRRLFATPAFDVPQKPIFWTRLHYFEFTYD